MQGLLDPEGHGTKEVLHLAQDFRPLSRRGNGRIAGLCNHCRNTEGERKDKQGALLIS
jgi:hypothetical protein